MVCLHGATDHILIAINYQNHGRSLQKFNALESAGKFFGSRDRKVSSVLIDEATQATEPETLISFYKDSSQIIMVEDHKQLDLVVVDKSCCNANLDRSMFERLIEGGIKPIRLQI